MAAALTFKPVTRELREDFEAVFSRGGPNYCWCMAWRATAEEIKHARSAERKAQMLGRIEDGVPVGLVGYLRGRAVAWVSVAPRDTFRKLGGPDALDGEEIWSLTCMFLKRDLRHEGHGNELIKGAIEHARKAGADVLEAYPVDPDSPSYRFMGFLPAFEHLGFKEIGRAGSRRHVVRLPLGG